MTDQIVSLVAAEPGWGAIYFDDDLHAHRADSGIRADLVEDDGAQDLIGLVIGLEHPTRIVPAPEECVGDRTYLDRYGFKED